MTFAAQTISKKEITLITLNERGNNEYEIEINCADVKFGVQLIKELTENLSN